MQNVVITAFFCRCKIRHMDYGFLSIGVLAMLCDVAHNWNRTNQSTIKQTSKTNPNKTSRIQPTPNLVLRPKSFLSLQVNIHNFGLIFCSASLIGISKSTFFPSFYFFSYIRVPTHFTVTLVFKNFQNKIHGNKI